MGGLDLALHLGERPTPLGAPDVIPEPGPDSFRETGRPRLGGLAHPTRFSESQAAVLNAIADTMIPPGDAFPAPSDVDIVTFVGRYLTPSGFKNKHYPFASEDSFKAGLDRLGLRFVDAGVEGRTASLAALEMASDLFFDQVRALVYYGYYSRPEVIQVIRRVIPAGRDYRGPPLPYGYLEVTEPWDRDLLAVAGRGGSYIPTDAVKRVDLSQLSWKK